jgi:uncharacterized protein YkwD
MWLITAGAAFGGSQPRTALSPEPVDSSACPGANLQPQTSNLERVRSATLCLVNQERALHGQGPLRLNRQLAEAAQRHTQEMVSQGYFNHVGPRGDTPLSRILATGYISSSRRISYTIGENIAWGTYGDSTPSAIVQAWIASPPHLANILDGRFRDTAIGVLPSVPGMRQPGGTYTQDFGIVTHG